MRPHLLILLAVTAMATASAWADAPLAMPARSTVISKAGTVRAVSDPRTGTQVERVKTGKVLWRLPSWYRWVLVADDGKHLVTGYDGLNLIPTDAPDDLVLFTFWRAGRRLEEVTLKELIPDRSILKRTASHDEWGTIEGIDAKRRLRVRRADDTIVLFDLRTGNVTR